MEPLHFKRQYVRGRLRSYSPVLVMFDPPRCKSCGQIAQVILEPDGACGDPECCPQSSSAEYLCPNMECSTTTEEA